MVNLRYHVVSLVAVFLALGVGIVVGSTVIKQGELKTITDRQNRLERDLNSTRTENRALGSFIDQSHDQMVRGRLKRVPVVVVSTKGVDAKPVQDLHHQLAVAEATDHGTLLFTGKMALRSPDDVAALATMVGTTSTDPDVVRRLALEQIAKAMSGLAPTSTVLTTMRDAHFIDYSPIQNGPATLPPTATETVRMIVVSGAGAEVGDDLVALPFARLLGQTPVGAVAVESGRDTPGGREVFVGLLRRDKASAAHLSTVDNLETWQGQVAAVMAVDDLPRFRYGDYGVAPDAKLLLPTAPTP
ncbi:MAG: hypothetical protein JWO37_1616 [Acidimicrobiales bacterium]|jgi:hypothetical protein|nr:hypothetical protein [Acidimicrobiales bacterium]